MKRIELTPAELMAQSAEMTELAGSYESLFGRVTGTLNTLNTNWSPNLSNNFLNKITSAQRSFSGIVDMMHRGAEAAKTSAETFESMDSQLAGYMDSAKAGGSGSGHTIETASAEAGTSDWTSGSVLSGSVSGESGIISGSVSGDVLGYSMKGKITSEWDMKDGNLTPFQVEGKIEGHIAQGELEGSIGILNGKVKGEVGSAGVKGSAGISLYKDGKLQPQISAGVKAEVAAAKGEASVGIGSEDIDVHAKAKGSVLGAKADAKAGIGAITYEDENGGTVTAFGVEASAGAEAYLAQGEVSGGFTLFGVKIDVAAEGKAGGAGAKAGGRVTTGGMEGELGLGLGLGLGLKVKIDWSNFHLF